MSFFNTMLRKGKRPVIKDDKYKDKVYKCKSVQFFHLNIYYLNIFANNPQRIRNFPCLSGKYLPLIYKLKE